MFAVVCTTHDVFVGEVLLRQYMKAFGCTITGCGQSSWRSGLSYTNSHISGTEGAADF